MKPKHWIIGIAFIITLALLAVSQLAPMQPAQACGAPTASNQIQRSGIIIHDAVPCPPQQGGVIVHD